MICSLILKEFTGDNSMNQCSQAVIGISGFRKNLVHGLTIIEADGLACCIGYQLFGDATGNLFGIGEQQLFEFIDVRKLTTVGQCVSRHSTELAQAILVGGQIFCQRTDSILDPVFLFGHNTITITPAADDVEILQSEARRIDP